MARGRVSLRSCGDEVEEADSGHPSTIPPRLSFGECWCAIIARLCAGCWERVTSPLACEQQSYELVHQGSVSPCEVLWADEAREQCSPSERWRPARCQWWILHVPQWCADRCLCCRLWREPKRVTGSVCPLQRCILMQRDGDVDCLKTDDQMVPKSNQPTKGLNRGGDLRKVQVDVPSSV